MKIYLNGLVVEMATEAGVIKGVYQKGSLNLTAINSGVTLVGMRITLGTQNTQLLLIETYDNLDPENRIADQAGVPYATAQDAWDALCAIVGFNLGGGGGAVTSVNGGAGAVTVDLQSVLFEGNDSSIRAQFNGVNYETENPKVVNVFSLSDLPAPVAGVITLPNDGKQYYFWNLVDLGGIQINLGENSFDAISQELAGIKNAVVNILETCTVKNFRFDNVEMIINDPIGAYDWQLVNFYDSPNCVNVQNADNIIWANFGFINSYNFKISGTINTFALSPNCIFRSSIDITSTYFIIQSTAVIARRFRIENSVFQTSFVGQKDINFIAGATIPDERFRLSNVLFQGIGTALTGINGNSIKALFRNNEGGNVVNSVRFGRMYMINNATPTPISVSGQATKVVGTFTPNANNQRFTFDAVNNVLTCVSPVTATYNLQSTLAISAGSNKEIGAYLCVCLNGNAINPVVDRLVTSENYIPSATGSRPDNITLIDVVELSSGDRVYLAVENATDTTNVTVEFANLIVQTNNV